LKIESVLGELFKECDSPQDILGKHGFLKALTKRVVARELRAIYGATALTEAEQAFQQFATTWDANYPTLSAHWCRDWERLTPLSRP